jgi:hypothetical protein
MSVNSETKKQNHRRSLRLLAAYALEHGLRFLPVGDAVRQIIEEDIAVVRRGNQSEIAAQHKARKKLKTLVKYTPAGLLFQGTLEMLYLARHKGYPSDGILQMVFYFPAEASTVVHTTAENWGREEAIEKEWQHKNLRPLEDKIFREFGTEIEIPTAHDTEVAA